MGKIIEGVWDCAYCGADKIRGSVRECPNCGRTRDINVTFYIDNPKNYVSDEDAAKINKEPDWVCPYCDCLNPATRTECEGCGAERNESSKTYFENQVEKRPEYQQEQEQWEAFHPDHKTEPPKEEPAPTPKPAAKKSFNWKPILKYAIPALLIIALVVGIIALVTPKNITGEVTDIRWQRSVEIEEYKTVRESDWSIPPGGREVSRSEEIHHYNQVISHYETKTRTYTEQVLDHYETVITGYRDLGNGHFEEITSQKPVYRTETRTETYEEPVYVQVAVLQTKYIYDIEKWVHKSYEKTSGNDNAPYWSDYQCGAKERTGSKTESYFVTVRDEEGNTKEYTLPVEQWKPLSVGDYVKLKTYITGSAEIIFD